jgi:hypothetical protein
MTCVASGTSWKFVEDNVAKSGRDKETSTARPRPCARCEHRCRRIGAILVRHLTNKFLTRTTRCTRNLRKETVFCSSTMNPAGGSSLRFRLDSALRVQASRRNVSTISAASVFRSLSRGRGAVRASRTAALRCRSRPVASRAVGLVVKDGSEKTCQGRSSSRSSSPQPSPARGRGSCRRRQLAVAMGAYAYCSKRQESSA